MWSLMFKLLFDAWLSILHFVMIASYRFESIEKIRVKHYIHTNLFASLECCPIDLNIYTFVIL